LEKGVRDKGEKRREETDRKKKIGNIWGGGTVGGAKEQLLGVGAEGRGGRGRLDKRATCSRNKRNQNRDAKGGGKSRIVALLCWWPAVGNVAGF